jgi:hypothetical protein
MEEELANFIMEQAARLVETEVLADQTNLVWECLSQGIFDRDDIENEFEYINKQGERIQEKELKMAREHPNFNKIYESEARDIYNWWLVGDLLAEYLSNTTEPMLENEYGRWWGRTTSGQPIRFDEIIQKIAEEIYGEG